MHTSCLRGLANQSVLLRGDKSGTGSRLAATADRPRTPSESAVPWRPCDGYWQAARRAVFAAGRGDPEYRRLRGRVTFYDLIGIELGPVAVGCPSLVLEACTYQAIDQLTLREVHAELSGERILTNQVMSNTRLRRRHSHSNVDRSCYDLDRKCPNNNNSDSASRRPQRRR